MSRYKYLEDKAKEKNKKLLIENVLLDSKFVKVDYFEKPKLVESSDKEAFSARGVVKNVKVSKFTENLNGRIYPKQLDERIIANNFAEGSLSLADHPDDDGSITRICGVWHNARVDENFAYGDWYLVGDHGQLILETLKAGGRVGVSRVGFGEFLEDGKTVDPESYELERYGDAVIRPSQEVFAEFENVNENLTESVKDESKVLENKTTNILSENKIEVRNMDKMTEATFKNQIRSAIKEAIANENYVEAIKELKEVSKTIPSEMVEQVAQVDSVIMQIQEKISTDKANAEKELKESKETLESLTEKYDVACKTIEQLKENLEKASKIVEKSSDPAVIKSMKLMEADIEQFTEDRIKMEEDIEQFVEEIEKRDADLAIYEEDTEKRDATIKQLKEEKELVKKSEKNIKSALKVAESHITKLEKILEEEYGYEFEDDNLMVATEDYDEPVYDSYDDEVIGDNIVDDYLTDEFDLGYEAGYEDAIEDEFYEAEDEEEELEEETDKEDDDEEEEIEEAEDEDKDKEDDDDKMAKVRDAKKESSKSKMKPEVISYYKAAVKETPALKDIKESILKSGSVFEAVKKVKIFEQKFGNDVHKLKENIAQDRSRKFKPYKLTLD